jgi:hypothetical protein
MTVISRSSRISGRYCAQFPLHAFSACIEHQSTAAVHRYLRVEMRDHLMSEVPPPSARRELIYSIIGPGNPGADQVARPANRPPAAVALRLPNSTAVLSDGAFNSAAVEFGNARAGTAVLP